LGLSERSDAVIVVISEERGEVSLVTSGEFRRINNPAELIMVLDELLKNDAESPRVRLWQSLFSNLLPKVSLFIGVCIFWGLVTTRQGQITTVMAPVRLHGVPDNRILLRTVPEEVTLQVKSMSSLTPVPSKLDLTAEVDASGISGGTTVLRVNHADITALPGTVITSVSPSSIRVYTDKKIRKNVPVKIILKGRLPSGWSLSNVVCSPATVDVEGAASQMSQISSIYTEDIDVSQLKKGKEYTKKLKVPGEQVSILLNAPVTIKYSVKNRL
jgi:hypothetical protein